MYKRAAPVMMGLIAGTSILAGKAYHASKEPLWVFGGLTMFSIIPFTLLFMKGIND